MVRLCQNNMMGLLCNELFFRIASTDQTLIRRWQAAFRNEGWESAACDSLPPSCARALRVEIYLVEVGTPLCKTPKDLQKTIETRKPAAILAFAAQESVSNVQTAKFLDAGADDFIFKNLDERILVAKLKAHIRRLAPAISTAVLMLASSSGDIEIDCGRRAVKIATRPGKHTELSNLTQKEFGILAMLIAQERRIVSRQSMLEELWGEGADSIYAVCIDKHIESLRRKLGPYAKRIKTVYGSGYMFTGGSEK